MPSTRVRPMSGASHSLSRCSETRGDGGGPIGVRAGARNRADLRASRGRPRGLAMGPRDRCGTVPARRETRRGRWRPL